MADPKSGERPVPMSCLLALRFNCRVPGTALCCLLRLAAGMLIVSSDQVPINQPCEDFYMNAVF